MHVLLRTDCQVTILELQVDCDVLLPGAACHSITIASQASTRTQAAAQCGAQRSKGLCWLLMIFQFACLLSFSSGARTIIIPSDCTTAIAGEVLLVGGACVAGPRHGTDGDPAVPCPGH